MLFLEIHLTTIYLKRRGKQHAEHNITECIRQPFMKVAHQQRQHQFQLFQMDRPENTTVKLLIGKFILWKQSHMVHCSINAHRL